jgi:transcriptional regulator with XRE-family HTH domain
MAKTAKKNTNPAAVRPAVSLVGAFSMRLKSWRAGQGFPLKRVAKDLGVSISIVSEWEHGHRFPSASNLEAVSRYVGIPVCCLLFQGRGHCLHMKNQLT